MHTRWLSVLLDYSCVHVSHPGVRARDPARGMGCHAFALDCVASAIDCVHEALWCRRMHVRFPACETRRIRIRTRCPALRVVETVVTVDCCPRTSNYFHIAVA